MPRAFLVKKTRGAFLEKTESSYDAGCLDRGHSKSPGQKVSQQSWHDVSNGSQGQGIMDRQTDDKINHSTFFKDEESLTVSSNRKWYATQTSPFTLSSHPAFSEFGGLVEPMDLSQVKPKLRVSSTSAFDQVRPRVRTTIADNTPTNRPNKLSSSRDVYSQPRPFAYEILDKPLDLQVRRRVDRDSPQSSGTITPDDSVSSLPVRFYDTFDQDGVEGPTPGSTLHSSSFQDETLSPYSKWIHGATNRRRIPYWKQERVTVLTSTTESPIKHNSYDISPSCHLDKCTFPTDINCGYTKSQQMQTLPQQLTNTSPGKGNHTKISPRLPITDNFSSQYLDLLRRSDYPPERAVKRPARQPVLGLEYIQNTPNIQDNENPNGDTSQEPHESDIQETDINSQLDSALSPTRQKQHTPVDVGYPSTEDISRPAGKAPSTTVPKPTQYKKYICDVCGKGFSRSNTLVTHKRIHTGDKPFKCELCGRAFRQPGNLTRHRLTHTTVKPYVCQQCGKAFNRASNLHTHMRTHTNYKPFECQYCGKGFHQKIDMKIHSYTHTGEKPHKCKKCGRGFKQLTHLTYHMRTHSEIKMYTCVYCGKGFNQKGNLQAHIYGHTGERPYHCEVCNKGFTLSSTLNTHRRTHADRKPYACQYCSKDFYQKHALKTHMVASHPYTGKSLL